MCGIDQAAFFGVVVVVVVFAACWRDVILAEKAARFPIAAKLFSLNIATSASAIYRRHRDESPTSARVYVCVRAFVRHLRVRARVRVW